MGDDFYVWPDGTWCYGFEIQEMLSFMSDDFEHIKYGTTRWLDFNLSKDDE